MTDAPYVFLGYGVTFGVIGLYAARLVWRCREAAKRFPTEDQPWR